MNSYLFSQVIVAISALMLVYSLFIFINLHQVLSSITIKKTIRYWWTILASMVSFIVIGYCYVIIDFYVLGNHSFAGELISTPNLIYLGLVGSIGIFITSKIFKYTVIELHAHQMKLSTYFHVINDARATTEKLVGEQNFRLAVQTEQMTRQRKAVLNVLEDVSVERDKTKDLADDLKKFHMAVENASDQILITDAEGIILYANKAAEHITGFSRKEMIGQKAGSKHLWGGNMDKKFYENLWHIIKDKKDVFVGDIKNSRKNGTIYYSSATISPVLDEHENVIYFVDIQRDITKLKEIDEAKTEFVSLASHQLRTPLSSVNWITEMLLSKDIGELNEKQNKFIELIYDSNKRMTALVEDLLNVSRIELGKFLPEPEKVNLVEIVESVIDELRPKLKSRRISIHKHIDSDMETLRLDPHHARMAIQNLLDNAAKYAFEGGEITVTIKKIDKGASIDDHSLHENGVLLSISDTGYGIPVDQQDKIFQKLFRAQNVIEHETDGTGLGLYIVKSLVERAGGKIWFKSEENKGTTFHILYPRKAKAHKK